MTRKLTFLESQLSEQDNALAGDKTTETLKPSPLSDKSLDDLDHQPASGDEDVNTQAGVIDEKSDTPASHLGSSTEKVKLLGPVQRSEQTVDSPIEKSESPGINWATILLWVILLLGVSLMLYMAYRLTRNMNEE